MFPHAPADRHLKYALSGLMKEVTCISSSHRQLLREGVGVDGALHLKLGFVEFPQLIYFLNSQTLQELFV